ncbi:hypothetical protein [Bradyrhizobium sp.]|jgi:hypothetical protein
MFRFSDLHERADFPRIPLTEPRSLCNSATSGDGGVGDGGLGLKHPNDLFAAMLMSHTVEMSLCSDSGSGRSIATEMNTGLIQLDSQARALIESAASLRTQIEARELQFFESKLCIAVSAAET